MAIYTLGLRSSRLSSHFLFSFAEPLLPPAAEPLPARAAEPLPARAALLLLPSVGEPLSRHAPYTGWSSWPGTAIRGRRQPRTKRAERCQREDPSPRR